MENFDWTRFTRRIIIKAPIATIYDAWTKAGEIEKWFLKEAKFYDANGGELPKNTPASAGNGYHWIWYVYEETEKGEILEANGVDFVRLTFANSILEVKLVQHESGVIVELTQKGIPQDDNSRQYIRLGCHAGWTFYLINLKSIYEGGIDLRNTDENLPGMLNV